jgi:DUF4097 and DUF4098 domain-containing protein YvlB
VFRKDGSIKGTWAIDSSLQVPGDLLAPIEDGAERHNLSLQTKDGAVSATVALLSPGPERASILLDTKDGSVKFTLVRVVLQQGAGTLTLTLAGYQISRKNDQPFIAQLKTKDGSISIEIPRSFTGPLRFSSHSGKHEFSKETREHLRIYSSECSFLGPMKESGFSNFETWKGDQIDATTLDGKIKVKYYGEVEPDTKNFLSWLGLS